MIDSAVGKAARELTVWRFVDGRRGHDNQSLGLLQALQARTRVKSIDIAVRHGWRNLRDWLIGRCPQGVPDGQPDLLIGAGHATHLPMLACRRARGGKVVVLMRPSLPLSWFDHCVIPQHDGVAPSERVFVSQGALNTMRPADKPESAPGMILLGGPSREYAWDAAALVSQLQAVVQADQREWLVAGSRRTPGATLKAVLQALPATRVQVVPIERAAPDWLATQLPRTPVAWVSEDSVSMVYEALSAQVACGILAVPLQRAGRVRRGIESLLKQQLVTSFDAFQQGRQPQAPVLPLDEAGRCAQWLLE